MSISVVIALVGVAVTIGTVLIAVGVLKQRINNNEKTNGEQTAQINLLASKEELAVAIKRSDELLDLMRKRVEEDRNTGEGKFSELYAMLNSHSERIGRIEVSQEQIFKMLDKLDGAVSSGFREMRDEMKDLRKIIEGK
jgi:hypothetical protein